MNRIKLVTQLFLLLGITTLLLYSDFFLPPDNTEDTVLSSSPVNSNPLIAQVSQIQTTTFEPVDLSQHLQIYMPEKTSPGITIIPLSGPDTIWAITENALLINEWSLDAERARLLHNGNILVGFGSKFRDEDEPWRSLLNSLGEYSWNGALVWEHTAIDWIHHDHQRLPNGNTIYLRKTSMPNSLLAKVTDPHRREAGQIADSIIEVDASGTTVWQWHTWEAFDVNYCGARSCTESITEFTALLDDADNTGKGRKRALNKITDWAHFNAVSVIPENKWFDAGDTRFKPGNLIIMPRKFKTVYIIDRQTKQAVWKYSGDYKGGLGGAHEPYMIEKGYPGEGNIMIFDNGGLGSHPTESYVLEVNPVTDEVVWVYDAGPAFNIRTRGGAQRLKNGNTLISEDPTGKVFEVTPDGEVVWLFNSPHPINRAKRYEYSYCPQCAPPAKTQ